MSEPQEIASTTTGGGDARPDRSAADASRPGIEIDGGAWVLVPLEDGESWNLKPTAAADGPRFAHITISERGYFSIDRPGTVRGPYVTLSEAADPLARHDAELLGPAEVRTPAAPPSRPGTTPSAPSGRAWSRDLVIVLVTVGVLAAGRRLMGGTRR